MNSLEINERKPNFSIRIYKVSNTLITSEVINNDGCNFFI